MKTFRQWFLSEGKDIFGFHRDAPEPAPVDKEEGPIIPMKADFLIEEMLRNKINGMEAFSAYPDQIQWGREPGAVRMVISPLGSFKSIIRKLQRNLLGEDVWVCKMIVPYKDLMHSDFIFDESFAGELFTKVEKIFEDSINAPAADYQGLRSLSTKLHGRAMRRDVLPAVMIPIGMREVKQNEHYIIHFECRGHGVETPGSGRLEAFLIEMTYDPRTGMIRSFGHDVQSPTKGHVWYPQPSEWDEQYSPSQTQDEIISSITNALSTY